jgi:serine/threonine protein kinase
VPELAGQAVETGGRLRNLGALRARQPQSRSSAVTQTPDPSAHLGEIVDDRYRIVAHVATGGMATVYRAEHIRTGAPVAIKVLHPEFGGNEEIVARFRREVAASRSIQHPSVVAALDLGRLPDGALYMVLEFIQGEDLLMLLARDKPFAQSRAVKIGLQVAQALVAAHTAGVIHRDLKPDNIMLVERGGDPDFVKVVDFGIAKVTKQQGRPLTALGSVFGTPDYMAPEQARGTAVDHRTDLYALGVVLYEMLAGRTPFAHPNAGQVLLGQISRPPPPLDPSIDPELASLVMQLLAKNPAERVQTAAELAERLQSIRARLEARMALRASGDAAAPRVPQPIEGPPLPWGGADSVPPPTALPAPSAAPAAPAASLGPKPMKLGLPCLGCAVGFLLLTGAVFVAWKLFSALF